MNLPSTHNATSLPGSADGLMPSSLQASPAPNGSGQEAVHASRSQRQGSKRVRPMSAISGQLSTISSESAALNTCLASRLQTLLGTAGSMEYRQTWKEKATPAGRRYWAHTASAHPTSVSGCTGWPTTTTNTNDQPDNTPRGLQTLLGVAKLTAWPTPTTGDSASSRNSTANRKTIPPTGIHKGDTLTDAATLAGWATPAAQEPGGTPEQHLARKAKCCANGIPMGCTAVTSLTHQAMLVTGWRSPAAGDCKMRISNTEMADKRLASGKQISLELEAHGVPQPTLNAGMEKSGASQLNPAFSLWLMGFPAEWASCGAVAMQLSRKQRRFSSRPALKPSTTHCLGSGEDSLEGIW